MWCSTLDKESGEAAKGKEKEKVVINLDDDDDPNKKIKTEEDQNTLIASSSMDKNDDKNKGKKIGQQSTLKSSSKTAQSTAEPSTSSAIKPGPSTSQEQTNYAPSRTKQIMTEKNAEDALKKLLTLWEQGKRQEAKDDCQILLEQYKLSEFPPNVNLDDHEEDRHANRDVTEEFCILSL